MPSVLLSFAAQDVADGGDARADGPLAQVSETEYELARGW